MHKINLFVLLILLFAIIAVLSSCGGGEGNLSISPTPTPSFITKNVSGYVYYSPSSYEDGIKDNFIVLDIPANTTDSLGNEPLLSQMTSYLQKEEASDWNNPDNQEMYSQINSELPTWKPLPEYNSSAKVMSVYSDPNTDTPLSIGSDGHFEGTVNVKTTDTNVSLQIVTEDNKYNETQTVSSSDISSQANTAELKSCPDRILSLPGGIELFEVYCPSVNLKEAGLTFTLSNSSLGCVTKPFYLTICGKANYNVAYGFFYAKKGLTTPVDSIITAKTNTGLSLSVFTEVIKTTASISGQVKGSPLFGYVYSIGTDGFGLLDSAGNYRLPKVFKGHCREVVAVWWANEGGKFVRHREVKVIPFFNGDLTGVNFSELLLTPTPVHHSPSSLYYDLKVSTVTQQFHKWKTQFGVKEAVRKTVLWLNGNVPDIPLPESIVKARIDSYSDVDYWIYFSDGMSVKIVNQFSYIPSVTSSDAPVFNSYQSKNNSYVSSDSKAETVGSDKILILAPIAWQEKKDFKINDPNRVYYKIANLLPSDKLTRVVTEEQAFEANTRVLVDKAVGYDVTDYTIARFREINDERITEEDINKIEQLKGKHFSPSEFENTLKALGFNDELIITIGIIISDSNHITYPQYGVLLHYCKDEKNIVTINHYLNMKDYGVIYIFTHGFKDGSILGGFIFENDDITNTWINSPANPGGPDGLWYRMYFPYFYKDEKGMLRYVNIKAFCLTKKFFVSLEYNKSIIYMHACNTWSLHDTFIKKGARVFLGYDKSSRMIYSGPLGYTFFSYLMGLDKEDKFTLVPMNIKEAHNKIIEDKLIPEPIPTPDPLGEDFRDPNDFGATLKLDTNSGMYDNTYLPASVNITIQKNK